MVFVFVYLFFLKFVKKGCERCYPHDRQHQKLAGGRTAEELFERTQRRLWELEHRHGYELHVIWGCELKQMLRSDPELRQKYNDAFVPRPLDPREDALRGGRTEPFALYYLCEDDEEIICIDIVILYSKKKSTFLSFLDQFVPVCDEGLSLSNWKSRGTHTRKTA